MDINTNIISLFVNGRQYTQFSEITVERDLETLSSSFEFVASNEFAITFPFSAFDNCVVQINGYPVLTGFITKLFPSYTNSQHIINILGYDKTKNVVDTEIYENSEITEATTFAALMTQVMSLNGITDIGVINKSLGITIGPEDKFTAAETGMTLFEYFLSIAQKKQVLLNTDGQGNIVIYRNEVPEITALSLVNKKGLSNQKIKSARAPIDYDDRYKTIRVVSQSAEENNIFAESTDSSITQERTKIIISDQVFNETECKNLADWEVNKRRADSIKYECIIAGYWADNIRIYQPGQIFNIEDDYAGMNESMLLKNVKYKYSENEGSICELKFVASDAYTLNANPPTASDTLGGALT